MKTFHGVGRLLGLAVACIAAVGLPLACNRGSSGSRQKEAFAWRIANPEIDARGGDVYAYRGQFSPPKGIGGAGGEVRIESVAGAVTLQRAAVTVAAPTLTLSGGTKGGLRIPAGHIVHLQGGHYYDWLDIEPGGTLVLTGNTTLIIGDPNLSDGLGDVYIGGVIQSSRYRTIDGYSLTIVAKGKILIEGAIDCSGGDGREDRGGRGGEVMILTTQTAADSFVLTGRISASGGGSAGMDPASAAARGGGSVTLSTDGGMAIQGSVRARGGDSWTSDGTSALAGGTIHISADGDLAVTGILQVSARGGDSDGSPGAGGNVSISAEAGNVNLLAVRIIADGGAGLRGCVSDAGEGGTIEIEGTTVTSSAEIWSRGGSILSDASPITTLDSSAGEGGEIKVAAEALIHFTGGGVSAEGGSVEIDGNVGDGGSLRVMGLKSAPTIRVDFGWSASVAGGIGPRGKQGVMGTVCVTGNFATVEDEACFYDQVPYPADDCES